MFDDFDMWEQSDEFCDDDDFCYDEGPACEFCGNILCPRCLNY